MSTHKHFDKICCVVILLTLILTGLFMNAEALGIHKESKAMGYESKLFDTSTVHTLNIIMDNWDTFVTNAKSEEYYDCTVVIDNEAYKNVAIRGKGNTSLSMVNNDRYSFKIEFDHYDSANTYYGLDKLCLNNIIQDHTYMKDYLTYQMMAEMGVASPLCSYVYITVNGETWGLYLAVEAVEDSFLKRNYGNNYGELYKPDSMSFGGGRGNGKDFNMDDFMGDMDTKEFTKDFDKKNFEGMGGFENMPNFDKKQMPDFGNGKMPNFGGFGMGSADVKLQYTDDDFDSYSNIFNNAKTDITKADKERLIEALKKLSTGEDLPNTVSIEDVIRYFVVHNFVVNGDSYTGSMIHNYYLYENNGQMQMIPWDYNLAFGTFQGGGNATSTINSPIDSPVSGDLSDRPMISWIFDHEEYTELYHTIFAEFIDYYFESNYFETMIDSIAEMIAPYVEKDPTKFCTYEEFEQGVSTLKEFCILRAESIRKQLEGSIGKTTDTQDRSIFVNADDLQISAMGSMGRSMGGDRTSMKGERTPAGEDRTPTWEDMPNTEGFEPPQFEDGQIPDFGNGQMPDFGNGPMPDFGDGQMPDFGNGQMPDFDNGQMPDFGNRQMPDFGNIDWMLLAVCVGTLAAGLLVAASFQRRKK